MKHVWLFLAEGFELVEALCPLDLLRRAGVSVSTVSLTADKAVTASNGVTVLADKRLSELSASSALPDMAILPGGMPGAAHLRECRPVCELLERIASDGGFVAAICAAPFVLGELGLLRGKRATCFPGFEDRLIGAAVVPDKVVRDGSVITAAGMGAALLFGAALVAALCGREKADEILASIQTPGF